LGLYCYCLLKGDTLCNVRRLPDIQILLFCAVMLDKKLMLTILTALMNASVLAKDNLPQNKLDKKLFCRKRRVDGRKEPAIVTKTTSKRYRTRYNHHQPLIYKQRDSVSMSTRWKPYVTISTKMLAIYCK
jgi:hypothetical protein